LHHAGGDDFGQVFIALQAEERYEIVFSRHRVDLGDALDLQEALGRFIHLPSLYVDENYGRYHIWLLYLASTRDNTGQIRRMSEKVM
jgi:hypothetical protein